MNLLPGGGRECKERGWFIKTGVCEDLPFKAIRKTRKATAPGAAHRLLDKTTTGSHIVGVDIDNCVNHDTLVIHTWAAIASANCSHLATPAPQLAHKRKSSFRNKRHGQFIFSFLYLARARPISLTRDGLDKVSCKLRPRRPERRPSGQLVFSSRCQAVLVPTGQRRTERRVLVRRCCPMRWL